MVVYRPKTKISAVIRFGVIKIDDTLAIAVILNYAFTGWDWGYWDLPISFILRKTEGINRFFVANYNLNLICIFRSIISIIYTGLAIWKGYGQAF